MNSDAPSVGDCSPADDVPASSDWDSAARVARLLDVVQRYAILDFSEDAPVGPAGDDLDALAAGINMLGEELHGWNLDFEQRVEARTQQVTATSERLVAEVAERRRAEAQLARANARLIEHVGHLRKLNEQIEQLTEMATPSHCPTWPGASPRADPRSTRWSTSSPRRRSVRWRSAWPTACTGRATTPGSGRWYC